MIPTYVVSVSTGDSEHLQLDLTTIEHWSQKRLMQFNLSKCFVMRITRKRERINACGRALGVICDTNLDCFVYEVVKKNIGDTRYKICPQPDSSTL